MARAPVDCRTSGVNDLHAVAIGFPVGGDLIDAGRSRPRRSGHTRAQACPRKPRSASLDGLCVVLPVSCDGSTIMSISRCPDGSNVVHPAVEVLLQLLRDRDRQPSASQAAPAAGWMTASRLIIELIECRLQFLEAHGPSRTSEFSRPNSRSSASTARNSAHSFSKRAMIAWLCSVLSRGRIVSDGVRDEGYIFVHDRHESLGLLARGRRKGSLE